MMSAIRNPKSATAVALALVAAIAVLLAAWLLPLPRLVLSDEEDAAKRMPETVAGVDKARADFEKAQQTYQDYVKSTDVGAALTNFDQYVQKLQADPTNTELKNSFKATAQPVANYVVRLRDYLTYGNYYFEHLGHFDDELMAWTRSLGTNSEVLRPDTWPIVEYLKLYPAPTGLKADYSTIELADLTGTLDALSSDTAVASAAEYAAMLTDIREAGRSIEYSESLNPGYATLLQNYHTRLTDVASGANNPSISGGRTVVAIIGNSVLALIIVAGLAALFLARKASPGEATS